MNKYACFSCLLPHHMMNDCKSKIKCVHCDRYHHTLHPEINRSEVHAVMNPFETPGMSCIFPIMRFKIKGKNSGFANVLWDFCASICLITDAKVKELGIKGTPSKIA